MEIMSYSRHAFLYTLKMLFFLSCDNETIQRTTMNRLESLPKELLEYIYLLSNADAIIKIQTAWRKYEASKIASQIILFDFYYCLWETRILGERRIDVFSSDVANITEYLSKVLSGREKISDWFAFLLETKQELCENFYEWTSWNSGFVNYNRTDIAITTILNKFSLSMQRRGW